MDRDDFTVEALLASILLCLLKITFFPNMTFVVAILPIIIEFGLPLVVFVIFAIIDLFKHEHWQSYDAPKVHWDYKNGRMYEDPPEEV